MTEVPEYLLERSRARRAALGLDTTGGPPEPAGGGSAAPTPAAAAPAVGPPPAPAEPEAAVPAVPETTALPAYVAPVGPRSGIPVWMMPVLLILPLWAIVYLGAFGETTSAGSGDISGAQVYQRAGCVACHGARGQGGVGPKLAAGEAALTFPTEADQFAFVKQGSGPIKGQAYGDPNRAGGQRVARSGGMPSFGAQLSDAEIEAVVKFEREGL